MKSSLLGFAILFSSPFLISFIHGLRTGRAWIKPRRRFRWVDRYQEPFWFWGAMVAYVAAAGWIFFFTMWRP